MKIIVDGLVTEYDDQGVGPTLLLLHGWKDSMNTFDPLVLSLSKHCRVIRLDLPGFGKTEPPHESWNLSDYVRFVSNFCVKLNISPNAIAGHSFGGRIAIKGISLGSFSPRRLILIASAGVGKRRTIRNTFYYILAKTGKVLIYIPPFLFYRTRLRRSLYRITGGDYFESGSMKNIFLNIINEDLTMDAQQVKASTLLVWGDQDEATPLPEGVRLSHLISGSKLEIIPGASHFIHKEHPEKVAEFILKHMTL
jgi:pimeloyl-ACP methyl ester carboxylesterase